MRQLLAYHNPPPETVALSTEACSNLENEMNTSDLSAESRALIIKSLLFMTWLLNSLSPAKVALKNCKDYFAFCLARGRKVKLQTIMKSKKILIFVLKRQLPTRSGEQHDAFFPLGDQDHFSGK